MVCLYCSGETQVINSRPQKRTNTVWRRRRCVVCKSVITTEEVPRYETALVLKMPNGSLQPFSRDILLVSLYKSLAHRKTATADAGALCGTIIAASYSGSSASAPIELETLKHNVHTCLARFDGLAGSHYAAYHKIAK